jgi:hypothetical protein
MQPTEKRQHTNGAKPSNNNVASRPLSWPGRQKSREYNQTQTEKKHPASADMQKHQAGCHQNQASHKFDVAIFHGANDA